MSGADRNWWALQGVGALSVALLPLLLSGSDPLRELPSLAGGLDPLLQCGILQWVLRHFPLHAASWQAPFFWPAPWSLAGMDSLAGQSLLVIVLPGMRNWPALAYNLVLAGTLALAFLAALRLGREMGLSRAAAWMAALIYTAGPHAAGHYHHLNQLPTPWLPLALWGLLRVGRGRWDGLAAVALSLFLQPLWGFYNLASLWMSVLLAVFFLLPSLRQRKGLLLGLIVGGGLLWVYAAGVPYRQAADVLAGFVRGPQSVGPYAGRPFDFLHPPAVHLLQWPAAISGRPVLYAGLLWPWLALWGLLHLLKEEKDATRRRLWWALCAAAAGGLILSFGRRMPLPWVGEVSLPLAWLQDRLWALQSLRAPTRLFLPGMLLLALAGSRGWMALVERVRRPGRNNAWRVSSGGGERSKWLPRWRWWAMSLLTGLALLDLMPGTLEKVRAQPDAEEQSLLRILSRDRETGGWIAFPTPCQEKEETQLDARCMLWAALIERPVAGGSSGFVPMEVRRLRRSCCRGPNEYCIADLRRVGVGEIVLPRSSALEKPAGAELVWEGRRWTVWRLH